MRREAESQRAAPRKKKAKAAAISWAWKDEEELTGKQTRQFEVPEARTKVAWKL